MFILKGNRIISSIRSRYQFRCIDIQPWINRSISVKASKELEYKYEKFRHYNDPTFKSKRVHQEARIQREKVQMEKEQKVLAKLVNNDPDLIVLSKLGNLISSNLKLLNNVYLSEANDLNLLPDGSPLPSIAGVENIRKSTFVYLITAIRRLRERDLSNDKLDNKIPFEGFDSNGDRYNPDNQTINDSFKNDLFDGDSLLNVPNGKVYPVINFLTVEDFRDIIRDLFRDCNEKSGLTTSRAISTVDDLFGSEFSSKNKENISDIVWMAYFNLNSLANDTLVDIDSKLNDYIDVNEEDNQYITKLGNKSPLVTEVEENGKILKKVLGNPLARNLIENQRIYAWMLFIFKTFELKDDAVKLWSIMQSKPNIRLSRKICEIAISIANGK